MTPTSKLRPIFGLMATITSDAVRASASRKLRGTLVMADDAAALADALKSRLNCVECV